MSTLYINEIRGNVIEAKHKVSAVVMCGGKVEQCIGDSELIVPMRSTAKPLMLTPLISSCEENNIPLTNAQISIMASSHNGEALHRETVLSIMSLSDSKVSDLKCGIHLPYFNWLYKEFFSENNMFYQQLYHNCSGKHAGMLLFAQLCGYSKLNYFDIKHPVQQSIITSLKEVVEISSKDPFSIVLDGCGVPTYCVSIKKLASAYRTIYKESAFKRVMEAIISEPYFIAGKDRIETDIIKNYGYIAKSGSSGLFCLACPKFDISIALKVEDGNDDAAESAIVEIMSDLGIICKEYPYHLDKFRNLEIFTSTQQIAGKMHPCWINE